MQNVADFLSSTAGIASSVITIIGFVSLVLWKPVIKPKMDKSKQVKSDKAEAEMSFRRSMLAFAEKVDQRMGSIEKQIDDNEKDRIRYEVLDFANSCRNRRKHTKDEFEHIVVLKDKYDRLLEKTGDSNGVFNLEYEYILSLYKQCQIDNDFL